MNMRKWITVTYPNITHCFSILFNFNLTQKIQHFYYQIMSYTSPPNKKLSKQFAFYSPKVGGRLPADDQSYFVGSEKHKIAMNSFRFPSSNNGADPKKQKNLCELSTPITTKQDHEEVEKMLEHYKLENKKLMKDRSLLFQKNCQLSNTIKNLQRSQCNDSMKEKYGTEEMNPETYVMGRGSQVVPGRTGKSEQKKLSRLLSPNMQSFRHQAEQIIVEKQPNQQNSIEELSNEDLNITQKTLFSASNESKGAVRALYRGQTYIQDKNISWNGELLAKNGRSPQNGQFVSDNSHFWLQTKQLGEKEEQSLKKTEILERRPVAQKKHMKAETRCKSPIEGSARCRQSEYAYPQIRITPNSNKSNIKKHNLVSPHSGKNISIIPDKLLLKNTSLELGGEKKMTKHPSKLELPNIYKFEREENRRLSIKNQPVEVFVSPKGSKKKLDCTVNLDMKLQRIRQQNNKLREQLKM